MTIAAPQSAAQWQHARALIEEYAASLDVDLEFQDLASELEHLSRDYGAPSGAFLLANDRVYLGCVGLRRFDAHTAEIKRLYVRPAGRGRGLGRLLAEAIVRQAADIGYRRVVLDTLPSMAEARSLYAALGFTATSPYRFNPVAGTAFLELKLRD